MNRGAIWKTSIEGWINNLFQIYDWGNHSFQNTFFLGTNITTNIETAALSIHPLPLLLRQTGKRGKKVDQTILVSLYTRPPFGQWTFGNNTLQKGDSRRCRAYKNFLKHLILADYSKNLFAGTYLCNLQRLTLFAAYLHILWKWNTVSAKSTHSPKEIQISPREKYFFPKAHPHEHCLVFTHSWLLWVRVYFQDFLFIFIFIMWLFIICFLDPIPFLAPQVL